VEFVRLQQGTRREVMNRILTFMATPARFYGNPGCIAAWEDFGVSFKLFL